MKIMKPKPFTFEAGPRAVLLLHGFTGHSADVRMLGRYLEKKGYTSHAPIYRGHGEAPEALIKTSPKDWWEDVQVAYQHLKDIGYEEIAVAGLSMGGTLALKLASENPVKGIVTMSTPMSFDNEMQLTTAFKQFVRQYKQLEQKTPDEITSQLADVMAQSEEMFDGIDKFVHEVSQLVDEIYAPAFVAQPAKDQIINPDSANFIYKHLPTDDKSIKFYENATHVITLGSEKDELHEDIYHFLEQLAWQD